MPKFRKKPVEIEAVQWDGENLEEVEEFLGEHGRWKLMQQCFVIDTLEGSLTVSLHDWVIRGVQGEFYPCKPDIFEATYEEV